MVEYSSLFAIHHTQVYLNKEWNLWMEVVKPGAVLVVVVVTLPSVEVVVMVPSAATFGNGTVLIYAGEAAITMVYDLFLGTSGCRRFRSSSFSVSAGAVVSFCKLQKDEANGENQ